MATTTTSGRAAWRITAGLLGLALGASTLMASAPPAAAAETDSDTLVFLAYEPGEPSAFVRNGATTTATFIPRRDGAFEGDFSAAPGTDLFILGLGARPDGIVHVEPSGTSVTTSFRPETVNGEYRPSVGDFDGNGIDDVLWYGRGPVLDSIWLFQPDGSHQIRLIRVDGAYLPIVLDSDGDGHDDVVWYGYGADPDSMWVFGPDATHAKRSVRIDGQDYEPFVGHFGGVPAGGPQEQLYWYDGLGPDSVWTFTETGRTSRSMPNEDLAEPIVGDLAGNDHDAVFWYRPGNPRDTTTGFVDGGAPIQVDVPQVLGFYVPRVGDFDGDGHGDIAWTRDGEAIIWHSDPTILTYRQTAVSTASRASQSSVAHPTVIPN